MNRDTNTDSVSNSLTSSRLDGKPQPFKNNTAQNARYLHTIVTTVTPSIHKTNTHHPNNFTNTPGDASVPIDIKLTHQACHLCRDKGRCGADAGPCACPLAC